MTDHKLDEHNLRQLDYAIRDAFDESDLYERGYLTTWERVHALIERLLKAEDRDDS